MNEQMNITSLQDQTVDELRELARDWDVSGYSGLKKEELIMRLLQAKTEREGLIFGGGVLDIIDESKGYLRPDAYKPSSNDIYVSSSQIHRFGLRTGDLVLGQI